MIRGTVGFALAFTVCITAASAAEVKRTWTFDDEPSGQNARGFTSEVGDWTVTETGKGKALAQTAKNSNPAFNITLINDTDAKEVDISVDLTAVAGELDQGGGIVWRARNAKNYYLARYNPLEDNYRLYKVVDGKRSLLENADIKHSASPHSLRVTMAGDHIACFYDGQKFLDQHDSTFTGSGKIGLWTKADAQSQFDNLSLISQ